MLSLRNVLLATAVASFAAFTSAAPLVNIPNIPEVNTDTVTSNLPNISGRNSLLPEAVQVGDLSGVRKQLGLRHHLELPNVGEIPSTTGLPKIDAANAVPQAISNTPSLPPVNLPGLRREGAVPDLKLGGANPNDLVHNLELPTKRAPATAQTVLQDFKGEVAQVSEQLKKDIAKALGPNADPRAKVDVSVVIPHLLHLKDVIAKVVVQLNLVAKVSVDIKVVADLVINLLVDIVAVIKLAVKAIVVAQISICLDVVAQVGVDIVALLKLVVTIIANIKITVAASIAADIHALGLVDILALVTIA